METDTRLDNIETEMKAIKDDLLKTLVNLKESIFADVVLSEVESDAAANTQVLVVPARQEEARAESVPTPCQESLSRPAQATASKDNENRVSQKESISPGRERPVLEREDYDVARLEETVSISKVKDLTVWALNSCAELGSERTISILEISALMGYMSEALRSAVEKCIPRTGPAHVFSKSMVRAQLKALKDLAPLLDKKRSTDFIILQIATQVLFSCSWPDPGIAPAEN
jgi:hypothetical protein